MCGNVNMFVLIVVLYLQEISRVDLAPLTREQCIELMTKHGFNKAEALGDDSEDKQEL
jgi:hypothetical protein